jgi:hypothetical protein
MQVTVTASFINHADQLYEKKNEVLLDKPIVHQPVKKIRRNS